MLEKQNRSFLSIINVGLLCCNVLLFVVLFRLWSKTSDNRVPQGAQVQKDAKELGMDIYCAKEPFAILVDKSFPRVHSFSFFDYAKALIFSGSDVQDKIYDGETAKAEMILGLDFSISCSYSLVDVHEVPKPNVQQMMVVIKNTAFNDLNADGVFDTRDVHDSERGHDVHQIWYEGEWRDVLTDGKWSVYERELPEIGIVKFDRAAGRWTPISAAN